MVGGYFITGTSTNVGKTFVTSLLLKAFRASGVAAVGYKPVACGSREDAEALRGACEGEVTLDEVNPLAYRVPAAPMAAVMIENVPLDWDAMLAGARVLRERFPMVLAEGVGGWKVPCTAQKTMADLAVEIGWPVIVVVDNRLGALNHTLLTLESIASHGLSCAGLILNQPEEERDAASISNTAVLSQLVEVPILAEIMYDQDELELPNELCG
ncbi:dethiobiotin synthase [Verrucomicrobiales bacterium]|nr:dethiobiotin synthase [Verrucomicrobiales bacterium]